MTLGLANIRGTLFRRKVLLYLASFSVCFILAFLLFFPLGPFARQLEQQLEKRGLLVKVEDPRLRFPLGVGAQKLQLSLDNLAHPPLLLEQLSLHPLWLSLGGDNPGLRFSLQAYQGEIEGSAHKDGEAHAEFKNLVINASLGPQWPVSVKATLDSARFDGTLPFAGSNRSDLGLVISGLQLAGMQTLGSSSDLLDLGQLNAAAQASGTRVRISNLSVSGPALELKGSGSLRLGRTADNSRINLNLVLTPKPALDPALKDLLMLLKKPQPDGSYLLNLRGSLTNPRLN